MALTKSDLDHMTCTVPDHPHGADCDILFMHGRCHPDAGSRVSYNRVTGTVMVECRKCGKRVAEVAVFP